MHLFATKFSAHREQKDSVQKIRLPFVFLIWDF
jgi:hypothetical protein